MDEVVKKDILNVLSNVIEILKVEEDRDAADLRELSNHTIHNSSIFQDEDSISIMVLAYSLSKVIERQEGKIAYSTLLALLNSAKKNLQEDKTDSYKANIRKLFDFISTIDNELNLYVGEVINQAQIKKGTKLYEHGISLARASEMLGVSQWDLMSYVGRTTLTEVMGGIELKERIKYARSLFK